MSANTTYSVLPSGIVPSIRCYAGVCRHAVVDVREPPTREPHHPPVFSHKQWSQNHQRLEENSALHGTQFGSLCAREFELHCIEMRDEAEIGRLNGVIAALAGNAIDGRSQFHSASAAPQNHQCSAGAGLEEMGCDSAAPRLDHCAFGVSRVQPCPLPSAAASGPDLFSFYRL
jgi:hypothetical protein